MSMCLTRIWSCRTASEPRVSFRRTIYSPLPVWIGSDVKLERGARIGPRVILGDRSVVEAGVRLRDAVVWDGARVRQGFEGRWGIQHDGGWCAAGPLLPSALE